MPNRKKYLAAAMILGSLALSACSGDDGAPDPAADGADVEVVNIAFKPSTLRVDPGTEITWTNADQGVRHSVTSGRAGDGGVPGVSEGTPPQPDGTFDGDLPDASAQFSFTLEEPGTYPYFCRVHPSMTGEIVVE